MTDKTIARGIVETLSAAFDRSLIRMKPGGKRPATPYISHGLVTKRLNDVTPDWTSRVVEMHTYVDGNGVLQCAGVTLELTIPGVGSRQEFGTSANRNGFGADAKNAMSDALKRCAMRFGVALDLRESAEENDEDAQPVAAPVERRPALSRPAPRQEPRQKEVSLPDDAPFDWTDFWAWAKPRGYSDRAQIEQIIGPIAGKVPAEIRRLLEAEQM